MSFSSIFERDAGKFAIMRESGEEIFEMCCDGDNNFCCV